MTEYRPMLQLPETAGFKAGDVLVLVGELFGRGYANGLIEEARRIGMTVIGTTVGRRDSDGSLRPLDNDELVAAEALLGGTIINIPLEAGFDMEAVDGQPSVAEQLKKARPDDLDSISFADGFIEKTFRDGIERYLYHINATANFKVSYEHNTVVIKPYDIESMACLDACRLILKRELLR